VSLDCTRAAEAVPLAVASDSRAAGTSLINRLDKEDSTVGVGGVGSSDRVLEQS
jgi:hypothetical protein